MKRHICSLLLSGFGTLLALASQGPAHASPEVTAEQILARYVEAAGGYEAIDGVQSLLRTGDLTFESTFTGILTGTVEIALRPHERIRTTSDLGAFTTTTAWDGTTGWEQGPQGFRILEGDELERLQSQSDLLFASELARSPGVRTERLADREIDGVPHYVVTVREDAASLLTLYVDQKTDLVSQTVLPIQISGVGDAIVVMDFWRYRPHQGILLPDTIGLTIEGIFSTQMVFKETIINGPVDESLFAPPRPSVQQSGR